MAFSTDDPNVADLIARNAQLNQLPVTAGPTQQGVSQLQMAQPLLQGVQGQQQQQPPDTSNLSANPSVMRQLLFQAATPQPTLAPQEQPDQPGTVKRLFSGLVH